MKAPPMDNQTTQAVVDMEMESSCPQGLGDRDERFRVPTPPITESICNQLPLIQTSNESDNHIIQPTQTEMPLVESTVMTNDNTFPANDEIIASSSKEVNNAMDDDQSKQIIIPNLSIEIEDNSNRSRDEFVKLLTKEAFISKSPSPTQIVNSHDDDSNSDTNVLSTRTVTLVSNNHQDNLIIKTTNIDQPEAEEEEEEEEEEQPIVKRIKVDLISPPPPLPNEGLSYFILSIIPPFTIYFRHKPSCYTER